MNMERRGFLKLMVGGVAAAAAVRTFPFRVFSFPKEIARLEWPAMFGGEPIAPIPLSLYSLPYGDLYTATGAYMGLARSEPPPMWPIPNKIYRVTVDESEGLLPRGSSQQFDSVLIADVPDNHALLSRSLRQLLPVPSALKRV